MSRAEDLYDEAEDELKAQIKKQQRAGTVPGVGWMALDTSVRRRLTGALEDFLEEGEEPEDAAKLAIKKARRRGNLPPR